MEIKILNRNEIYKWDEFVKTAVNGTIYSESIWGDISKILDRNINYEIVTVQKNGKILGGILIFVQENKAIIPKFTPYVSVLYRNLNTKKNYKIIYERRNINNLIGRYLKEEFKQVRINQNIEYNDIRDFKFNGYIEGVRYTYVNYLNKYSMENISGKNKRKVKNIDVNLYEFVLVKDIKNGDLQKILFPFFDTMTKKVFNLKKELKENIIKSLIHLNERALIYYLKDKKTGEILSTRVELIDSDLKVEDWIAGTTEKGRDLNITMYFTHNILLDLKARGYKMFDWNGANTAGVTDFKRNFSGELKLYTVLRYHYMIEFILKGKKYTKNIKKILRKV